jgi:hypothetical protein
LRYAAQAKDCVDCDLDIYNIDYSVTVQIVGSLDSTQGLIDEELHGGHVRRTLKVATIA